MRLPSRASRFVLTAAGISLAVALPAQSQDKPESILPPGFGETPPPASPRPSPAPRPAPKPGPASGTTTGTSPIRDGGNNPRPASPSTPRDENSVSLPSVPSGPSGDDGFGDEGDNGAQQELSVEQLAARMPSAPILPIYRVGPLNGANGGLAQDAFGAADGMALAQVLHRTHAPLPSRWASILLRRTLLSNALAPRNIAPADWIAERAWLLVRMGEADAARMLVQSADPTQYSPFLLEVAMQTYLANADPGGLCPLAERGVQQSKTTGWILARAMCSALSGEAGTASAGIDQALRTKLGGRRTVDLTLAEKVVGAGTNGRRSVTIEWDGVKRLTAWRYGLATATGVEIPAPLLARAPRQIAGWQATAQLIPVADQLAVGRRAAVLGVVSSAALVDLYSGAMDRTDAAETATSPALKLQRAYTGNAGERIAALREIWNAEGDATEKYAALILTARASAAIPAQSDYSDDAAKIIGAMLSAGLDRQADAWSGVVGDAGSGDAWALLAAGSPKPRVPVTISEFSDYAGSVAPEKARMVLAGLAGLGRLDLQQAASEAEGLDFQLAKESQWSRLLGAAVDAQQPGTVVILAAAGMQAPDWRFVPPDQFYHIISALHRVGLDAEARMIVAEAISRL